MRIDVTEGLVKGDEFISGSCIAVNKMFQESMPIKVVIAEELYSNKEWLFCKIIPAVNFLYIFYQYIINR